MTDKDIALLEAICAAAGYEITAGKVGKFIDGKKVEGEGFRVRKDGAMHCEFVVVGDAVREFPWNAAEHDWTSYWGWKLTRERVLWQMAGHAMTDLRDSLRHMKIS